MMLKNAEEGRLIKINTKQNCYNYINFFIIFYTKKRIHELLTTIVDSIYNMYEFPTVN